MKLRIRRKQMLKKTLPLNPLIVPGEPVLMCQFGDKSVKREQLNSFAADSDRPNIILRVLPIPALHPVSAESFTIFSFGPKGKAILHHVVATKGLKANFYIENQQETYLHLLVFNTLLEAALDTTASKDLILQIADSHWRG